MQPGVDQVQIKQLTFLKKKKKRTPQKNPVSLGSAPSSLKYTAVLLPKLMARQVSEDKQDLSSALCLQAHERDTILCLCHTWEQH